MRAVAAAHRQGVIHRDLKPDNIFLAIEADTAHPIPKVLDFGISKLEPRGEEQLSLTRSGSTLGTPRYMSYEQLIGDKNIDVRTDVYSLGVILYEALTGQLPYDAESFPELIVKVATQAPTFPKELRADIPTPLARIILWAMARDRDQRIPNVDALINELTPFSTEYGFRAQMTLPEASVPSFAKPDAAPERAARPSAAKSQRPPESIGAVAPVSTVSSARLSRRTLASVALGLGGLLVLALMLWLGASAPTPTLREPLPAAAVVPPLPTLAVEPRAVTAEPESVKASTRLELSGSAREQELDAAAAQALPTALQEPSTSPAAVREGHSPVMRPAGSTRSTSKPPVATKRSERSAALDAAVDAGASAPARATEPRVSAPESPAFRVRTLPKSSDF
jgi:serine/threonine-protein kinase